MLNPTSVVVKEGCVAAVDGVVTMIISFIVVSQTIHLSSFLCNHPF